MLLFSHPTSTPGCRRRDQRLTLAGYTVIRFTWRQITHEPQRVTQDLRNLLAEPNRAV